MSHPIIVSAQKYREGFSIFQDGHWVSIPYTVIEQLPGGEYLVEDPAFQGRLPSPGE